MMNSCLLP
ncbi:hypothetical protein BOH78_1278 [Pichia kudriavzevii]|uniref:Uncharacterized protein n=1 Tax=Pichia kudriavzevii TaxID=4909 RepID=A0A1V2LR95_PICKU|nr:hypothetical protein BOH78_1278 [Pichia kudriavzevii]